RGCDPQGGRPENDVQLTPPPARRLIKWRAPPRRQKRVRCSDQGNERHVPSKIVPSKIAASKTVAPRPADHVDGARRRRRLRAAAQGRRTGGERRPTRPDRGGTQGRQG